MNPVCAKCGIELDEHWSFCPHCGDTTAHETVPSHEPREHENPPVQGAFTGLLLGLITTPVLLIAGTILLITGIGALPGILMIIGGLLAPLLGPILGIGALHGKCPWCGAEIKSLALLDRFSCPTCKGKIQVRKRELKKAA